MVTAGQLKQIIPRIPQARVDRYLDLLNQAMDEFQINTRRRRAAFLAQVAHESAGFKYMEEIASGAAYEGRRDLGNTVKGDGKRFKGRGPIQITGRANYERYGALLGLDLIGNPKLAADPSVGFRLAGAYWKVNSLNRLADVGEFGEITRRINGGYNGLKDRKAYYERALTVLTDHADPPATVGGPHKIDAGGGPGATALGSDTGGASTDDGTQTNAHAAGAVSEPGAKEVKTMTMSTASKTLSFSMIGAAILGFLKTAWETSQQHVIDGGKFALTHLPLTIAIIGLGVLGVWIYNTASKRRDARLKQIIDITADKDKNDVVIT